MYKQSSMSYLWGFLLVFSLISCMPITSGEQTRKNDTPAANSTSLPMTTTTVIKTPSLPIPTDVITPFSANNRSLPCSVATSTMSGDQIGYQDIYPGKTTTDTIEDILGLPVEIHSYEPGVQEWMFKLDGDIGTFPITLKDGVVTSISLPVNIPLVQIFGQYGCPDVVFIIDMSEHKSGQYSAASLVYLQVGTEFIIEQFPLNLSDEISMIHYFSPGSIEHFLDENPSLQEEAVAKQVSLEDVFVSSR